MEERKLNFKDSKEMADKGSEAIRLLEKLICENLAPEERGPYFEALEHLCCNGFNMLIIAIYDGGYEMSIWYDNKRYDEESNDILFKKIKKEYNNKSYNFKDESSSFENFLKSLNFNEIYVCEDGNIVKVI